MSEVASLREIRAAMERLDLLAMEHPELLGESSKANREAWQGLLREGETQMAEAMEMLAVRLPKALIRRLDTYCKRLEDEGPGLPVRRSDVVRLLLTRGLDDAEKGSKRR